MHKIRRSRLLLDMDQWTLGEAIGKSASWISLLERGRVQPDSNTLARLAEVLGIGLVELQEDLEMAAHD
jgi:transcriptional regulator with XRE-family HTH domain